MMSKSSRWPLIHEHRILHDVDDRQNDALYLGPFWYHYIPKPTPPSSFRTSRSFEDSGSGVSVESSFSPDCEEDGEPARQSCASLPLVSSQQESGQCVVPSGRRGHPHGVPDIALFSGKQHGVEQSRKEQSGLRSPGRETQTSCVTPTGIERSSAVPRSDQLLPRAAGVSAVKPPRLALTQQPLPEAPVYREPLPAAPVCREPLPEAPVCREPLADALAEHRKRSYEESGSDVTRGASFSRDCEEDGEPACESCPSLPMPSVPDMALFSGTRTGAQQAGTDDTTSTCSLCGIIYQKSRRRKYRRSLTDDAAESDACDVTDVCAACRKLELAMFRRLRLRSAPADGSCHECDICGGTCVTKSLLSLHYKTHIVETRFRCDTCGRNCHSKGALVGHQRVHTGERPFKCDVCGKAFARKHTLATHYRVHTGERPYKCEICGVTFSSASMFSYHQKKHAGDKSFECGVCGKTFMARHNLSQHLITHSSERPFKCDTCGKAFARKDKLGEHCRSHSGEINFKCGVCGKVYTRKDKLKDHHRRLHADGEPCDDIQ